MLGQCKTGQGIIVHPSDAFPCPEVFQSSIIGLPFPELIDFKRLLIFSCPGIAFQNDAPPGLTPVFSYHHYRAVGEDIVQICRLHIIGIQALKSNLYPAEYRGLHIFPETLRLFFCFAGTGHQEGLSFAHPGHPFQQKMIDRTADAKGEKVGRAQVFPDQVEGLAFHVHIAIRDDHKAAGYIGSGRHFQGGFQGRE